MFGHEEQGAEGRSFAAAVKQWIVSLAVSVVCCSVLFIVFAGYIVRLNEVNGLLSVRVDLLQTRNAQLLAEIEHTRKRTLAECARLVTPPPAPTPVSGGAPSDGASGSGVAQTPPLGAKINDIMLPVDEMMPPDVVLPVEALSKTKKP